MSESDKKPNPKQDSASTEKAKIKSSNDSLQKEFDEANEKGYFGTTPETRPNEDFTVQGVTKKVTK